MSQAFILGAGLGTRLRALTESLPKPLIPVYQKPLITYAFDHLIDVGIDQFMINTHHCPDEYGTAFPDASYRGASLAFRNEADLLETAGGIANIADWRRGTSPSSSTTATFSPTCRFSRCSTHTPRRETW